MKKSFTVCLLLLVLFIISTSSFTQSQSTDDWTMFGHDIIHTRFSTSTAPTTNQTAWIYTTGGWISYSSPAIVNGEVYVGCEDNSVYCIDAASGNLIWRYLTGGVITSSPAVAGGLLYIGSFDKSIYCLNATNGNFIWKYTANDILWGSPVVADGKVYIGSNDTNVYCLDYLTGCTHLEIPNRKLDYFFACCF